MTKSPRRTAEPTPKNFPEVTPPSYGKVVGDGYLIEAVMQMQATLGEIKSDIGRLKEDVKGHGSKLDTMSHRLYAAGVVIAIILAVGGWLLNKLWDGVFALIQT